MKTLGFIAVTLALLICPTNVWAWTLYAVDNGDDTVSLVNYNEDSKESFEEVLTALGLADHSYVQIAPEDLPAREDRNFFRMSGGRVVVDSGRKAQYQQALQQELATDNALRQKLNLTEAEFARLRKASARAEVNRNGR